MPIRSSAEKERAARRAVTVPLRKLALLIGAARETIRGVEKAHFLPASPYDELLGAIEEYYQSIADEFEDMPDEKEPLQSFAAAHEKVRALAAVLSALATAAYAALKDL